MKKAAVLSIAAFYLLLTTGMFVCIVHCAAENLTAKTGLVTVHHDGSQAHRHKKPCKGGDDCGCCKQHGNYTIKENIKPGFDFQVSQTTILAYYSPIPDFLLQKPVIRIHSLSNSNAPPGISGKAISIRFRSLLI